MNREIRVRLRWGLRQLGRFGRQLLVAQRCPACAGLARPDELCGPCHERLEVLGPGRACRRCSGPLPCVGCADFRRGLRRIDAAYAYRGTGGALVRRLKLDREWAALGLLGRGIARRLAPPHVAYGNAVCVPVPLAIERRRERGFNQAEELARFVAARLRIRLLPRALRRVRSTLPQGSVFVDSRRKNIEEAFGLGGQARALRERDVILIDDVVTSGATLRECSRVLRRRAGVRRVEAIVACSARCS